MAYNNAQARTGNKVVIVMDGVTVGALQDFRGSDDYAPEPVSGIGDAHAIEYCPGMARHTLSAGQMVLESGALRKVGLAPENADAMLRGTVFDVQVQDKASGQVLRTYRKVSYASGDLSVNKHQIIVTQAQFNACDVDGTGV